jgi:flagellar biosynthetic protein FliQ
MTSESLLDLWRGAFGTVATVAAPFLVAALAVGLVIAIVQTATQLQEATLSFVPKLVAALIVLALAGHWALDQLGRYTTRAFTAASGESITEVVQQP